MWFSREWNGTVLSSKSKDALRACLFKNTSFDCYLLVSLIRKSSTLENKIRNQFTVRSRHSNMLQQHASTANEWMIPWLFKNLPMTFFLQVKIRIVKWNNYIMIQVFVLYENMLAKWQRMKNGKNKWKNGEHKFRMVLSAAFLIQIFLRWQKIADVNGDILRLRRQIYFSLIAHCQLTSL